MPPKAVTWIAMGDHYSMVGSKYVYRYYPTKGVMRRQLSTGGPIHEITVRANHLHRQGRDISEIWRIAATQNRIRTVEESNESAA